MKMRWVLLPLAALMVASVGYAGVTRSSITDYTAQENWQECFQVGQIPEELWETNCALMKEYLPQAPYILRVEVLGDLEIMHGINQQKVKVTHIYAGEGIREGQEFYLYADGWRVVVRSVKSIERNFINVLEVGREYLVFLEEEMETLDSPLPVYSCYDEVWDTSNGSGEKVCDFYVSPIFSYDYKESVAIQPSTDMNTYVPYTQVKDNEFFGTTQKSIELWEQLKAEMLQKYPR